MSDVRGACRRTVMASVIQWTQRGITLAFGLDDCAGQAMVTSSRDRDPWSRSVGSVNTETKVRHCRRFGRCGRCGRCWAAQGGEAKHRSVVVRMRPTWTSARQSSSKFRAGRWTGTQTTRSKVPTQFFHRDAIFIFFLPPEIGYLLLFILLRLLYWLPLNNDDTFSQFSCRTFSFSMTTTTIWWRWIMVDDQNFLAPTFWQSIPICPFCFHHFF